MSIVNNLRIDTEPDKVASILHVSSTSFDIQARLEYASIRPAGPAPTTSTSLLMGGGGEGGDCRSGLNNCKVSEVSTLSSFF
jgi:hypothetical protein